MNHVPSRSGPLKWRIAVSQQSVGTANASATGGRTGCQSRGLGNRHGLGRSSLPGVCGAMSRTVQTHTKAFHNCLESIAAGLAAAFGCRFWCPWSRLAYFFPCSCIDAQYISKPTDRAKPKLICWSTLTLAWRLDLNKLISRPL